MLHAAPGSGGTFRFEQQKEPAACSIQSLRADATESPVEPFVWKVTLVTFAPALLKML